MLLSAIGRPRTVFVSCVSSLAGALCLPCFRLVQRVCISMFPCFSGLGEVLQVFHGMFHGHPHRAVTHHTHDHAHKMITTGCALFAGVDVVTPVGGGLARSVARRHVDAPSLRRPRAVGREGRV